MAKRKCVHRQRGSAVAFNEDSVGKERLKLSLLKSKKLGARKTVHNGQEVLRKETAVVSETAAVNARPQDMK